MSNKNEPDIFEQNDEVMTMQTMKLWDRIKRAIKDIFNIREPIPIKVETTELN